MNLEKIISWLGKSENIIILNSVSACIIGVAALIVSIINARFVGQQTRINKELFRLQIEQKQPYFIISTPLEKDSDDDSYGTEHLIVKNNGFANVPSKVSNAVLFELIRIQDGHRESVLVKVEDYFFVTTIGTPDSEIIYHSYDIGNNRKYYDLYMQAITDRENGVYYVLNKIILVKIDYKDLLKINHSKYFIENEEVDEKRFIGLFSKAHEGYHLHDLKYEDMKVLFERR